MQVINEDKLKRVNEFLEESLKQQEEYSSVLAAMHYSSSAGGKRVRPMLVLSFAEMAGGDWEKALPFAAAIEMLHTYSLIHDDLPCMDDDDMRRGRPSCHIQYGEATALLAGDGLLTYAFETASSADLPPERIVKAIQILSHRSGVKGMVGGQELDLANEGKSDIGIETLKKTDEKKTADLLIAACQMGIAAAGGNEEQMDAAQQYGYGLGIAFQIIDDILDVTSNAEVLGKPIGSDAEKNKPTYASILGLENARSEAQRYTEMALDAIKVFPDPEPAVRIANALLRRDR